MMNPLISIIMRNFNTADLIPRAVQSVFSQSLLQKYWQLVVIDDGSTDQSLQVISKLKKKYQFTFMQTPNIGAVKALNEGIKNSTGDYFTICDADDELAPGALSLYYKSIQDWPQVEVFYGDYLEFISDSLVSCLIKTNKNLLDTIAGGILFQKKLVLAYGGYDEQYFFPEYDLLLYFVERGSLHHLAKVVYHYYRRPGSLTSNEQAVKQGVKEIQEKYGKSLNIRKY